MKKDMTKLLYFTAGLLAAILIILSGFVAYKYAQPDKVQAATSTYTETWTASNYWYSTGSSNSTMYYVNGTPASGSTYCGWTGSYAWSAMCMVTVSGWSVSGTVTLP